MEVLFVVLVAFLSVRYAINKRLDNGGIREKVKNLSEEDRVDRFNIISRKILFTSGLVSLFTIGLLLVPLVLPLTNWNRIIAFIVLVAVCFYASVRVITLILALIFPSKRQDLDAFFDEKGKLISFF